MSFSAISKSLRAQVLERDAGFCRYCRLHQFGQGAVFHINHVIPRSRDGKTSIENLVLQCPYCSLHKSDRITGVDPVLQVIAPIFHPLQMDWLDHFEILEDAEIVGKTSVGRVTVQGLGMNDEIPVRARTLQRLLGISDI